MTHSRTEVRVGIFVFVGLTILCSMIIMFGFKNIRVLHDVYRITASFKFTNGIVVGAPVRLSGVDVGKIDSIEFAKDENNSVYLHMDIQSGIVIRKDVRLIINSLGIMGEKYLEFIPKSASAEPMKDGDVIIGEEPIPLNDVVMESLKMIDEFKDTFREIFNEETKDNIRETIKNLKTLTDEETQKALKNSLKNLSRLTGPKTRKQLHAAFQSIDETVDSLQSVVNENREDLRTILIRIKNISESFEKIASDIKASKGTLGLLVSSPELHESLDKTILNMNEWITLIRKHGLLYKEKDVRKEDQREQKTVSSNRGVLYRRR